MRTRRARGRTQDRGRDLVIVANRLPVDRVVADDGGVTWRRSPGGLVSALEPVMHAHDGAWIGWDGGIDTAQERFLDGGLTLVPIPMTALDIEEFYEGFSNASLWPLYHDGVAKPVYHREWWDAYVRVNRRFADAAAEITAEGGMVWVQDYQLQLVPAMLRELRPDLRIGFFLHIPFPTFEMFRLLPRRWRQEILEGLLGADLVGFHTFDYMQYFQRSVRLILGLDSDQDAIPVSNRIVRTGVYPMGIDFNRFHQTAQLPDVQAAQAELKAKVGDRQIIFSVDRLDYTKGILNRLEGYALFLERNPESHGRVVFNLVVVPSRTRVEQYQRMKQRIDETVGQINGQFGSIDWTPIVYEYRSLSFKSLVARYANSDVGLITPLRDGMNLVAKEYVAAQADRSGVLILSEMTGAAEELREALIINPNHKQEIADALAEALELPLEERVRRNQIMQEELQRFSVFHWVELFVGDLLKSVKRRDIPHAPVLDAASAPPLLDAFRQARRRLLFLDYDGTLVPFALHPHLARPGDDTIDLLQGLAALPDTQVVVISGRDRDTLERWLSRLDIGLIAEHGIWLKEHSGEWEMIRPLTDGWKGQIAPVLDEYVERVPGSFVEEKDYSLVWHYRRASLEQGKAEAEELKRDLRPTARDLDLQVLQGNKVVEVKNTGVNKGLTALHWLTEVGDIDFVLAIGDDRTDEDLFEALPATAYTVKVGLEPTAARHSVRNQSDVVDLLTKLVEAVQPA